MIATLGSASHPLTASVVEKVAVALHDYFAGRLPGWEMEADSVRIKYRGAALAILVAAELGDEGEPVAEPPSRWARFKGWARRFIRKHVVADDPWDD